MAKRRKRRTRKRRKGGRWYEIRGDVMGEEWEVQEG